MFLPNPTLLGEVPRPFCFNTGVLATAWNKTTSVLMQAFAVEMQ